MFRKNLKQIIYTLIILLVIPEISFSENKKRPLLTWKKIRGAHYYIIEIKNNKNKIIKKEKVQTTEYFGKLKEGIYQVRITGHSESGKQYGKSKWSDLVLKKALKPGVDKITPPKLTRKIKTAKIFIKGLNFVPGTRVFLKRKTKKIPVTKFSFESNTKINFIIYPKRLPIGEYDVILVNPGGKKSISKNAIEIEKEKPGKVKKEDIKISKRTGLLGANGLFLGIGYQYGFILPDWDNVVDNSFLSLNMILFYDLGGFHKLSKRKVLKNFGFDFKGSYLFYPANGKTGIADSKLQIGTVFAGLHYKDNFSLPIYFVFRIFFGMTFTTLRKDNGAGESIPSSDLALDAEFAILYKFKENYFIEIGVEYLNSFFAEKEFRSINPSFRIGFIL